MKRALSALILLGLSYPCSAEEPPKNLVSFTAWGGEEIAYTPDSHTNRFAAGIMAEGLIVVGRDDKAKTIAKLVTTLDLRALPGEPAVDLTAPQTWGGSAELHVGAEYPIGRMSSGSQTIETAVGLRFGWSTSPGDKQLANYPSDQALVLRLSESKGGAFLGLGPGHNPLVGPGAALLVYGAFPLVPAPSGSWAVALQGDLWVGKTAVMRVSVGVRK